MVGPWVLVVAVLLSFSVFGGEKAPNILFIIVDDLSYSDVGCYGNTLHETPNVDRLAKQGIRFTDAYSASAVCSPSRAAMQTGQHPIRFGITDWIPGAQRLNTPLLEKYTQTMLPLEATTLAEVVKQHGYQTAFVGKWHLNHDGQTTGFPDDQGYDVNIGGFWKGHPPGGYFAPFRNPTLKSKPDDRYLTDRMGDEAVALIKHYAEQPADPFFLMLSFYTVHTPIQPRKELKAYYQEKLAKHPAGHWNKPEYAAMVHSMDENLGRVLDELEKQNLTENTIVVFVSDNGGLTNYTPNFPLKKGKGYYHEGGVRVPLIIRKPGLVKAGMETDVPVVGTDLFPTVLDLAGLPLVPDVHKDGVSLKPVINGGKLDRKAIYWHYPHYHGSGETPTSAIRLGDYKLIRHYENGELELYNLRTDIGEQKNLMTSMPEKAEELRMVLDAWLKESKAYMPGPNPDFDPSKPRNVKRPRK